MKKTPETSRITNTTGTASRGTSTMMEVMTRSTKFPAIPQTHREFM